MTNDEQRRAERAARLEALPSTGHSRELRRRLREQRDRLGLTLEDVAARIAEYTGQSISASSVSHYEHFRRHPPVDVMAGWARSLGMRLLVDITPDEHKVAVPLSPRIARLARALEGADEPAVDAIEAIILRMLPVEHEL